MSSKDDKLPSYPSGYNLFPENYRIEIDASKMRPLGFLSHSDRYKKIYQEVIRRDDTLLDKDDNNEPCFCVHDYFDIYVVEEPNGRVIIRTEEGDIIKTDNIKEMHREITAAYSAKRDRDEAQAHDKQIHDMVEAAGAVMYDHDVIGDTSVTDLVNAMEGKA